MFSEEKKSQRPRKGAKGKVLRDDSIRSFSEDRRNDYSYDRRHPHPVFDDFGYYEPYYHDRRGPVRKTFDSDFDQDAKAYKVRRGPRPYDDDLRGVIHPNAIPHPRRGGRGDPRDFKYGAGPGFNPRNFDVRAERPFNDHRPGPVSKYDREDRPGFFAGNRDFRADKFRNQPL